MDRPDRGLEKEGGDRKGPDETRASGRRKTGGLWKVPNGWRKGDLKALQLAEVGVR